jgi:hypothetical protein
MNWLKNTRPISLVLEGVANNKAKTRIFVRDFIVPNNLLFTSDQNCNSFSSIKNIQYVWARVEGIALANILNVLGQINKKENIEIVEMSKDTGLWDSNIIIIGAQAQKCFDFYRTMEKVAYRMDAEQIRDGVTDSIIPREDGYGYGIIIKTINPYVPKNNGIGILIGGYGVLGTEAASYYFRNHCAELGNKFKKKSFGIVVRAAITAGAQSVERLSQFDKFIK